MSDIKCQTRAECSDNAVSRGLSCFFAGDRESDEYSDGKIDEIFLDLDDGAVINEKVRDCMLRNGVSIIRELTTVSASGNRHVYWKLSKSFTYAEIAALQAALGSDPVREMLTILSRDFSALYETPEEAARVIAWRQLK